MALEKPEKLGIFFLLHGHPVGGSQWICGIGARLVQKRPGLMWEGRKVGHFNRKQE